MALEELDGIESAAVSLNEGRARVRLKPDNTLELGRIRQIVEQTGFTPKEARVTARATVVETGRALQVRITGTSETHDVAGGPNADKVRQELKTRSRRTVVIDGMIPPPDKQTPSRIEVTAVKDGDESGSGGEGRSEG